MSFITEPIGKVLSGVGGMLGGGSKGAAAPASPSAPASAATPAVQAAADSARMRERAASGRASTMLTSQTDEETLNPTARKRNLGGKLLTGNPGTTSTLGG